MDYVNLTANDFIAPVIHSHAANELEQCMAAMFAKMIDDTHLQQLNDIYDYGVPWQGSKTVVERFTKFTGLAVLRRDDGGLSDDLMRVIYSNWVAIASERGVSFLQFVLDMLYPSQCQIVRLWHPKAYLSGYPRYVVESASSERFLTSRIRIKVSDNINLAELSELAPTITRLVPWQVVPEVAVSVESQDMGLVTAVAGEAFYIVDYSPY